MSTGYKFKQTMSKIEKHKMTTKYLKGLSRGGF